MLEGLTKLHTQSCGPVQINTYFSPSAQLNYFGKTGASDPWRYRIVFEVVNNSGPAGLKLQFLSPAPLFFFFKIGLQTRDGSFRDLTQSQIGLGHVGEPTPREVSFAAKGDAFYDRISYAAFASIAPPDAMREGLYRVTLAPFPIVSIDGKDCLTNIPPMDIKVVDGL